MLSTSIISESGLCSAQILISSTIAVGAGVEVMCPDHETGLRSPGQHYFLIMRKDVPPMSFLVFCF